jgi:hypothetical protein
VSKAGVTGLRGGVDVANGDPCARWSSVVSTSAWSLLDDMVPAEVRDEFGGEWAGGVDQAPCGISPDAAV